MRYDVLREFACRGGGEAVRLNAYVSYDSDRGKTDAAYRDLQYAFFSVLRDFGYKVIEKQVKWFVDDDGARYAKANADLDMAVDMLQQSAKLDRILLVTGDGDFARLVQSLQNNGCRVEIVAFENVSAELRREADLYLSGYLIPGLLPTQTQSAPVKWGDIGSRVRGTCYHHGETFGFVRFLKNFSSELWRTDTRQANSPYETAFFHDSQLPPNVRPQDLPNRNMVFEFELELSTTKEGKLQAKNLVLVASR